MKNNLKKDDMKLQKCMGINGGSIQKAFFQKFFFFEIFFWDVFGHKHAWGSSKNRFDGLEL